jgi:hypothetical protein
MATLHTCVDERFRNSWHVAILPLLEIAVLETSIIVLTRIAWHFEVQLNGVANGNALRPRAAIKCICDTSMGWDAAGAIEALML